MAYVPTNWTNGSGSAINETNLNNIENGIVDNETVINIVSTDVEIIKTAVSDTGLVNAMVVNTFGTFDMAKNGNVTPFIIPLFTNTGTATLSIDGGAVTGIRKANDAGILVALEAGDIKKNVPTQFVLDTVSGFFVYAPKGGGNIKSIQIISYAWESSINSKTINITQVKKENAIALISSVNNNQPNVVVTSCEVDSDTTILLKRNTANASAGADSFKHVITIVEFNNVKSKQTGVTVQTNSSVEESVTISEVNLSKSLTFVSLTNSLTSVSNSCAPSHVLHYLLNPTTLRFLAMFSVNRTYYWQVLEFN